MCNNNIEQKDTHCYPFLDLYISCTVCFLLKNSFLYTVGKFIISFTCKRTSVIYSLVKSSSILFTKIETVFLVVQRSWCNVDEISKCINIIFYHFFMYVPGGQCTVL